MHWIVEWNAKVWHELKFAWFGTRSCTYFVFGFGFLGFFITLAILNAIYYHFDMDSGVWWNGFFFFACKIIFGTNVAAMSSLPYPGHKQKDDNYPNRTKAECFCIKLKHKLEGMNLVFFRSVLWKIILLWACCGPVSLGLYILFEFFCCCCFHLVRAAHSKACSLKVYILQLQIWMNLIWFSFFILFLFCSTNKMYSFEMKILRTPAKQRRNIFLLIHIFFVGWKKWFKIFQRNDDEYTKQAGQMRLFQMKFSKNNFHSGWSRTVSPFCLQFPKW